MGPVAFAIWALLLLSPPPTEGALQLQRAIDRVIARNPPVTVNDEARRLERLAAQIGIDLAPPLPDRPHPLLGERDLVEGLHFGAYLSDEVEAPDDRLAPPSAAITSFLAERAEPIDEIRAVLLSERAPRWAMDLAKGKSGEPDPNSSGPLVLQRILLTKALVEARAGRASEADLWLRASWRLNESTAARPTMVWQLIAIAVSRWEAGVLRKVPSADSAWIERMQFASQRQRAFAAMSDDFVIGFIDPPAPEEFDKWSPGELLAGISKSVESLQRQDPCAFPRAEADRYWKSFFPGPIEKTLAGIAMPSLGDAAHRLYRLQIEGELTDRVLQARQAAGGAEPPQPGTSSDVDSSVCPGARWSSLVLPGGGTHVTFAGRFADWPNESGIRPPLEYTIRSDAPPRP